MIYLDSAATSYHKPDGVARAVAEAISHMGNPGRGAHEASLDASRVVYGTRENGKNCLARRRPARSYLPLIPQKV